MRSIYHPSLGQLAVTVAMLTYSKEFIKKTCHLPCSWKYFQTHVEDEPTPSDRSDLSIPQHWGDNMQQHFPLPRTLPLLATELRKQSSYSFYDPERVQLVETQPALTASSDHDLTTSPPCKSLQLVLTPLQRIFIVCLKALHRNSNLLTQYRARLLHKT